MIVVLDLVDSIQHRFEECALGHDIDAQRGLVEDQQLRTLRERHCEVDAGTFTTRQA